jgi:phosphonate metabolism transcriptional regulator PhnF
MEVLMIVRGIGVACYQQLSDILMEQIENKVFKPGNQLPTEIELSKVYKLNRHTVRQAIERLENEGFVYKMRGKGTFVANNKIPYKISKKVRFTTSILDVGLTPDARLIDSYETTAGRELSDKLDINLADKVTVLEILRFVNKIPFSQTTSYLSSAKFPDLKSHISGSFSLYGLLREQYGVEATRISSTFEVSLAEQSDMDILQIPPRVPLLIITSISKSQHGEIAEYCITKVRGDLCKITVDFDSEGRYLVKKKIVKDDCAAVR